MRAALIQSTASDDPAANLAETTRLVEEAVAGRAGFVLTPEVMNCVSSDRAHQEAVLCLEEDDPTLAALRGLAADRSVWILAGSIALLTRDADRRFANRSFLIGPDGGIVARYDKLHMFDVNVSESEVIRESARYRPGSRAVMAQTPFGTVGMSVCYDLRFPQLYRRLAKAGATILTVPALFHPVTGAAHWEPLLRARAIESGAYVLAPAQTGEHAAKSGAHRRSYGHSMAVSPWGEVLVDASTAVGVSFVDLLPDEVDKARRRIPSLTHDRDFEGP